MSKIKCEQDFVIFTGKLGMEKITNIMKKMTLKEMNESLKFRNKVSITEFGNINRMIDSPDSGDLMMAENIIIYRND